LKILFDTTRRFLKIISGFVCDFIFPERCVICSGTFVPSGRSVCPVCTGKIQNDCEAKVPEGVSDRAVYWDKMIPVHSFSGYVPDMIHLYKSGKRPGLSDYYSDQLAVVSNNMFNHIDFVTSPPPSMRKMKKRGFDPAGLVARKFAAKTGLKYRAFFYENRKRKEQKRLGSADRFLNSLGRFSVKKRCNISGKHIIIIDDVLTTGATLNECARILKKMGAETVFSLTIAAVSEKESISLPS
jgi:competence protein ComFC